MLSRLKRWGALTAILAFAGCAESAPPGSAPTSQTGTTSMVLRNPVYDANFADPFVLEVGGEYFAFATNGPLGNVQTLRSPDLIHWEQVGDALPKLPSWSTARKVWAPEVAMHGPDRFLLYYTTADDRSDRQCVSLAVASRPEGPYVDQSRAPLVCQPDEGGSIDASPFVDAAGNRYLYWKNDGNAVGIDTWIYGSRLSPDGMRLVGERIRLFKQDLPWEGNLVEAPFMLERDGMLHMFYSANAFDKPEYAVGHALCQTALGPCKKSGNPVLTSSSDAAGPGHNMVIRGKNGKYWFIYHAWDPALVGVDPPGRTMWFSELTWTGDAPVVTPPSRTIPQPATTSR